MKKLTALIFLLFLSPYLPAEMQDEEREPLKNIISDFPKTNKLPKDFKPVVWFGEKLEFKIKWGLLKVGHASMNTEKVVYIDENPYYYIKTTAKSTPFVDTFFKVRDLNESIVNSKDLSSMGFAKKIREGNYLWDEWVLFNYEENTFLGQKKDKEGKLIRKVNGQIPGKVQDILSAIYFVRTHEFKVGKSIKLDVNSRKNWPLIVKILKKETVEVPAGKFECFVVEPKLRDKGIFIQKGKSMTVWMTADKYHMPVMMKAEVFIGNVSAVLESYSRKKEKVKTDENNSKIKTD